MTGRRRYLRLLGVAVFVVFGAALIAAPGSGTVGRAVGVLTVVLFGAVGVFAFIGTRRAAIESGVGIPGSTAALVGASSGPTGTVLPVPAVVDGSRRAQVTVAAHAFLLMTYLAKPQTSEHREVVAGIAAALVVGAVLIHFAPVAGRVVVVATELTLVFFDVTAGHQVAVATRVLYMFFPVCVILSMIQTWRPREPLAERHSGFCS